MAEPLTLDQAKQNLRVDTTDDDDFITDLIVAAREHVEDYTGLVLTRRAVTETAPGLGRALTLSSWPVASIDGITYLDRSGASQSIDASAWYPVLAARPARINPVAIGWGVVTPFAICSTLPVTVTMTAGFATPDDVPAVVKRAMHLLIGTWYANRESDVTGASAAAIELPAGVRALLRRSRRRTM